MQKFIFGIVLVAIPFWQAQAAPVAHDVMTAFKPASIVEPVKKGGHPPGWNRGRKRGWGGGSMPPGQMKKRFF